MSKPLWRADEAEQTPERTKGDAEATDSHLWRADKNVSARVKDEPTDGDRSPLTTRAAALWDDGEYDRESEHRGPPPRPKRAKLWGDEPAGGDTETPGDPTTRELTPVPTQHPGVPSNGHRKPPPPPPLPRAPSTRGARMRRRRRRFMRRRILIGVALLCVLLIADGAYVAFGLKGSLEDTERSLSKGASALSHGDLGVAENELNAALDSTQKSMDLAHHPSIGLLSLVPNIGDDASTLRSLSEASELAARAGLQGLEAARAMGADQGSEFVDAIYSNGRVNFDALNEGRPFIERAVGLLQRGDESLNDAPQPNLDPLRDALHTARDEIGGARDSAQKSALLFGLLPKLLGGEGERKYLLAFQAPGEARGTGGLFGLFGILRATDGTISLESIQPGSEFFPDPLTAVRAPGWFERAYGPQKALTQFQQSNLSPRFPTVAQVLLRMYAAQTGEKLDGVVAMDPVAFAGLLRATGPITDLNGRQITADNAPELLMHDSYVDFPDPDEQNAYLADLIDGFWSTIHSGDLDGPQLAQALGEAVRSQHFKLWARSADQQKTIEELGAHGWLTLGQSNVQMVFSNNYSVNKVDYYLQRSIDTKVELNDDGSAQVTTTVTVENQAPTGPPSLLLGPGIEDDPPGLNRMVLNVLMPKGSFVQDFSLDGEPTVPIEYNEGAFPVAGYIIDIPAGETAIAKLHYTMPDALDVAGGRGTFSFTLFPQATVNPDAFSLSVAAAEGSLDSASTKSSGVLDQSRSLRVSLSRDRDG